MTNLEALQATIGSNYPLDPNLYTKALIDQNIIPGDEYIALNARGIDLAFAGVLLTVITSVDIKEGGYSVTNADRASLIKVLNGIYAKYGLPLFGTPTMNNASNKW